MYTEWFVRPLFLAVTSTYTWIFSRCVLVRTQIRTGVVFSRFDWTSLGRSCGDAEPGVGTSRFSWFRFRFGFCKNDNAWFLFRFWFLKSKNVGSGFGSRRFRTVSVPFLKDTKKKCTHEKIRKQKSKPIQIISFLELV